MGCALGRQSFRRTVDVDLVRRSCSQAGVRAVAVVQLGYETPIKLTHEK